MSGLPGLGTNTVGMQLPAPAQNPLQPLPATVQPPQTKAPAIRRAVISQVAPGPLNPTTCSVLLENRLPPRPGYTLPAGVGIIYPAGSTTVFHTTSNTIVAPGSVTITPLSMGNVAVGNSVLVQSGQTDQETVTVTAVTSTTWSATFTHAHSGVWTIDATVATAGPWFNNPTTLEGGSWCLVDTNNMCVVQMLQGASDSFPNSAASLIATHVHTGSVDSFGNPMPQPVDLQHHTQNTVGTGQLPAVPPPTPTIPYLYGVTPTATTCTTSVASGTNTVTPVSMLDIFVGAQILVDTLVSGVQETVTVTAATSTTFTATFAHAHSATWTLTPQVQTTINAYGSVQGVLNDYSCQTFIRNFPQDHSVNKLTWAFRKTPDPTTTNPGQGGALFIQAVAQASLSTSGAGNLYLSFTSENQPTVGNLVVVIFNPNSGTASGVNGWTFLVGNQLSIAYKTWTSTDNDALAAGSGSINFITSGFWFAATSYEITGHNQANPIAGLTASGDGTAGSTTPIYVDSPSVASPQVASLPIAGLLFYNNEVPSPSAAITVNSGWTFNGYNHANQGGTFNTQGCAFGTLTSDTTTPQECIFDVPIDFAGMNVLSIIFFVQSADPGNVTPGVTYPWVYWAETDVPGLPNPQSEQGVGFSYGQLSLGVNYDFGVAFVNTGGVAGPVGMFAQAYASDSLLIPTQYLHDGVVFTPSVSPGIPSATIEPAPTIVQTATPSISGTNDAITLTFGSTPTLGNNMLAVITWDQTHAGNLLTPAGWTLLEQVANNGTDPGYPAGMAIYYKVAGASEPTGPTFTLANSDQTTAIGLSGYAQEWNGAGSFLHVTDSQTNNETSPAISTSTANAIPLHILSIVTTSTGLTYTPLAGWTMYGLASTSSLQIAQGPTTAAHLQHIEDIMTVTGLGSANTSNGLVLVMPIVASDSVAPITIAPGVNGTTSNIQVALQFTNQPLDGSLYAAAFWYRQTGSGTTTGFVPSGSTASGSVDGWSLYAAVEADGIYDPLGSLPLVGNYVFVFQDLSNGLTYDFGFSAINNRGGSSDIVVIPVSGQMIPYAPGGVVTNSTANLVPDSGFDGSTFKPGHSGTGHGWGNSQVATTNPSWYVHGLDGDHTVIVKQSSNGVSEGGGGIGGDRASSGTLIWALTGPIQVTPGAQYSIGCYGYAQTSGGPMFCALVDATTPGTWTTIYKQVDVPNGTLDTVVSDLPWLCPPDGSITKVAFLLNNGSVGVNGSGYQFLGQPMMNPGATTSVYVKGPPTSESSATPTVETLSINSQGPGNAASAPTITSGSGAPTAAQPVGSTYYNQSASTPVTTQYTNTTGGSGGWVASGPQSVEALTDVQLSSLTNGQTLEWNSTASKWENATPAASGVASLEGLTGSLTFDSPDSSVTISTSGSTIHLEAAGGGGGGGGGGNTITLSSTPVTNPWNESGNPLANSILYGSTATYTLPTLPGFLRIRACITLGSSSVGWLGVGVGDGTHMVTFICQSNGYWTMSNQSVANGGSTSDQLYQGTGLSWATGDTYFVELVIAVGSSTNAKAGGNMMTLSPGSANSGANQGIPIPVTANLSGPLTFYGLGSAVTDIVSFAYDTSLF